MLQLQLGRFLIWLPSVFLMSSFGCMARCNSIRTTPRPGAESRIERSSRARLTVKVGRTRGRETIVPNGPTATLSQILYVGHKSISGRHTGNRCGFMAYRWDGAADDAVGGK